MSPATELLMSFPEDIPGIKKIEKHAHPNSHYILAHIQQVHRSPFSESDIPTPPSTQRVQEDIRDAIDYLAQKEFIRGVHMEGVSPVDLIGLYEKRAKVMDIEFEEGIVREEFDRMPLSDLLHLILDRKIEQEGRLYHHQLADFIEKDVTNRMGHVTGELFLNGKIELFAGEKKLRHILAIASLPKMIYNGVRARDTPKTVADLDEIAPDAITEDREDALLDLVAGREHPLAVAIYGGLHSWCNNIYAWNEHRNDDFSHIILTPESLDMSLFTERRAEHMVEQYDWVAQHSSVGSPRHKYATTMRGLYAQDEIDKKAIAEARVEYIRDLFPEAAEIMDKVKGPINKVRGIFGLDALLQGVDLFAEDPLINAGILNNSYD